jgi:hypothetical protein
MEWFANTLIIAGLVGTFSYPVARMVTIAYFQSKLEYQNQFFRKFDTPNRDTGAK